METFTNPTVGATVATNYKTAAIFQKYGIDFCCGGGVSIAEACKKRGLSEELVWNELKAVLDASLQDEMPYHLWPVLTLKQHVVEVHHAYIRTQAPAIIAFLQKLCQVHGARHQELYEIYNEFVGMAEALLTHLIKEEQVLFPAIEELFQSEKSGSSFAMLQHPMEVMEEEHETEGLRMARIRALSNDFTPPADACTTYKVAFQMLKDFESDLHMHIHLENNILFPKSRKAMEVQ